MLTNYFSHSMISNVSGRQIQNNLHMREWLSWWSTTLPRSGPRVRVPSRALKGTRKGYPNGYPFLVFEPRRGSKVRGLRSASVVAEQTSPGRFATSRTLLKSLKMLINTVLWVFFFFSKAVDSLCRLLKSTGNSIICLFLCQWIADISKRSSEITVP